MNNINENNELSNPNIEQESPLLSNKPEFDSLVWIIIAVLILAGGLIQWYIARSIPELDFNQINNQNQQRTYDDPNADLIQIKEDLNKTDLGDIDKEFETIDQDLNSL